jgi:hypothetical protein
VYLAIISKRNIRLSAGYLWYFFAQKKGNTGDRGKKLFIIAIAFFWSVSVLKKS